MYNSMNDYYIPKLSKVIPGTIKKKPETPEALRKLLQSRDELELDDTPLSDCGSEISDAFADLHKGSLLFRAKNETATSKLEADWLTMTLFTDNFKQTLKEVREEMKIGQNMMNENPEDIIKILKEERQSEELPLSVQNRLDELLKDREYMCSTPSQASDDPQMARRESSVTFDALSGVWRMLDTHNTSEKFKISAPNFNAFQQKEPHWLDRPQVPWETINFSKLKCEKWLSEQDN